MSNPLIASSTVLIASPALLCAATETGGRDDALFPLNAWLSDVPAGSHRIELKIVAGGSGKRISVGPIPQSAVKGVHYDA